MRNNNLAELKNIDLSNIDEDSLVDITKIEINKDLSPKARMLDFIKKVKNPYCFKVGEYTVKSTFDDSSGVSIDDCIENLLMI